MTTEERAEKIDAAYSGKTREWFLQFVAAEIRAAVEDGRNEIRRACSQHQHEQFSDGFKAGKAEAYEDAAKIVETLGDKGETYLWEAPEEIRAQAKALASKSVGDEKGAEQHAE